MASIECLVAGLGNPGPKYVGTPHNAGFDVVDRLAAAAGCRLRKRVWSRAAVANAGIEGVKVCLMQPLTYMNRSGYAVASWVRYYRLPLERLLVVVDDIDRPLGTMRLRGSGSSGGHKGLRSIIEQLGSESFPRLRIGVGRNRGGSDVVRHVLTPFSSREKVCFEQTQDIAVEAVGCLLTEGLAAAMNRFNGIVVANQEPSREGCPGGGAERTAPQKAGRTESAAGM